MNTLNKNLKRHIAQIMDTCLEKQLHFSISPHVNLITVSDQNGRTICRNYYTGKLSGFSNYDTKSSPKEMLKYLRERYK